MLSIDAYSKGLGACVSHTFADGTERPITDASRVLSAAEEHDAQIEKEGLAGVYGLKKFHLYGRKFKLVSDHKPLTRIFDPKVGYDIVVVKWALLFSGYTYDIEYRTSQQNANANMLSRFPVDDPSTADPKENFVFKTMMDSLPVNAKHIAECTRKDPVLAKVHGYTLSGWPSYCMDKT